ncbi:MAG TPA: VOC family protein [Burkholderiales bacterium]|nr:VOC family protein [Burkholderiales bacterium]
MPGITTLRSYIDHIVVTAPSLAIGVEYVRDAVGVTPQAGGEHPRMGTHNCLLRLGDALYLEVISINPAAANPDRPRWFHLNRERSNAVPRLVTWISRTNDIRAATAASTVPLGNVEAMSRGSLSWQITIPTDGDLPLDGVAPTLIEWKATIPRALSRISAAHWSDSKQTAAISNMLQTIGFQDEFHVFRIARGERPHLVPHIETSAGLRKLCAA